MCLPCLWRARIPFFICLDCSLHQKWEMLSAGDTTDDNKDIDRHLHCVNKVDRRPYLISKTAARFMRADARFCRVPPPKSRHVHVAPIPVAGHTALLSLQSA
jgi:hypothetical protein